MRFIEAKVILLASTALDTSGVVEFLESIGAPNWATDAPSDGEALIELAGRGCYNSFEVGLNPNLTGRRDGNRPYVSNLIAQKHWSVLEHVSVTFGFLGISRVATHELVRHWSARFSQQSLRFVRLTDLGCYLPEAFAGNPEAQAIMVDVFERCEQAQLRLAELFNLDNPERTFAEKKAITSAMRRCAPIGLTTNLIMTANLRSWRHIIEQRTSDAAEEEIRKVIGAVRDELRERFPNAIGNL
jgi:thymidylate synthase (FAD)